MRRLFARRGSSDEPEDRSRAAHLQVRAGPRIEGLDAVLGDPRLEGLVSAEVLLPVRPVVAPTIALLRALSRAAPCPERLELVLPATRPDAPYAPEQLGELATVLAERSLRSRFGFVLDADADAFAHLAGRPTSLGPIVVASRALIAGGHDVRWWVPTWSALVHRLEGLFDVALALGADPILVPSWALPFAAGAGAELSAERVRFAQDFLEHRLAPATRRAADPERLAYYRWLAGALDGVGPRRPPGARPVATLDLAGVAKLTLENTPALADAQALPAPDPAPTRAGRLRARLDDVGQAVLHGDRALLAWVRRGTVGRLEAPRRLGPASLLRKLAVIGASGEESWLDAAALGGALWRAHERFGALEATVLSPRPAHTERLARGLDLPVRVAVRPYERGDIERAVGASDGLVYVGGALDEPSAQLSRHLHAAATAQAGRRPVLLEGLGARANAAAPAWAARRLSEMAARITARAPDDAAQAFLRGLDVEVALDPALEYAARRGLAPTRLTDEDRGWVEGLLEGTGLERLVGVQVSPSPDAPGALEASLAEVLKGAGAASKACLLFFPLRATQAGGCDLRSAYELQRQLPEEVDLRVWQADPGLDGVLALLTRLDLVIATCPRVRALAEASGVAAVDAAAPSAVAAALG